MTQLFAYIDPGAGSLIIQALVAAALAVPFFFRRTISTAMARLRGDGDQSGDTLTRELPSDDSQE